MTNPTDLDAILASIRARITGEVASEMPGEVSPPDQTLPPEATLLRKTARLLPTPLVDASGVTVEALLTGLLEPMLRQWLEAHLPEICERVAQQEVRRLTGQP